jgi:parallel beta-helix repeat protein
MDMLGNFRIRRIAATVGSAAVLVTAAFVTGATAAGASGALYVSPTGSSGGADTSCATAAYATIQSAVTAAPASGTVIVCQGTYTEDVLVSKALTLRGIHATINATGLNNGIVVVASGVTVKRFTITGARGEGIAVFPAGVLGGGPPPFAPVSNVQLLDNRVISDNTGYVAPFGCTAPGLYPADCGGGILLDAVANSVISGNTVEHNVDGILIVDDFGPTHNNLISGNNVSFNVNECGITLPSHNGGAATAVHNPDGSFTVTGLNPTVGGVFNNIVQGNVSDFNGTAGFKANAAGSGAGVLIAAPAPGTAVYNNVIENNEMHGNGLAGLTFHAHYLGGEYVDGNKIIGNTIGQNNTKGDILDTPISNADFQTTGILLFSSMPVHVEVSGNHISSNHFGIWATPNLTLTGSGNTFSSVAVHTFLANTPYGSGFAAINVTSSSATLIGIAVPNGFTTTAYFQFGQSPPLFGVTPPQTIGAGVGIVGVSANLSGLSPSTTYLFQLVMSNVNGTSSGFTAVFTTAP